MGPSQGLEPVKAVSYTHLDVYKRQGQNFLIDNHVIERICELSELAGDERVLEVGPGCGTLTLALLQEAACVTSIEADPELEPVLDAHAADYANFRFIMGDALKVTPEQIEHAAGGEPTVFVANLPYNVAATIILQFFQTMPALKRAVVMVQKEVEMCIRDRFTLAEIPLPGGGSIPLTVDVATLAGALGGGS